MLFLSKDTLKEKYVVTQEDEIVMYGYNEYCRRQADRLIQGGYNVVGIIDINPQNIGEYKGIPIGCSIEDLTISEKTCIFIMLQNGMLHWNIAFDIYKHGVNRVVFLPMKTGFYSNDVQSDFIIQYNYMVDGMYSFMHVPYLCDEMFTQVNERKWYIAKQLCCGEYIIWVSTNLIRTTLQETEKYRDIPIADFIPYVNLFSYLSGNEVDITEYIKIYGKAPFPETSEEAYSYVLNKRRGLYDFFEDKFTSGNMDYFTVAAPKAVWNENGYWNLCEGQHRCVYLIIKGMKKIPVRIDQVEQLPTNGD